MKTPTEKKGNRFSTIEQLFFELIRVAIGTQESLSRLPSARERGELYKMAQKQSLVGVCFAGLRKLDIQEIRHSGN